MRYHHQRLVCFCAACPLQSALYDLELRSVGAAGRTLAKFLLDAAHFAAMDGAPAVRVLTSGNRGSEGYTLTVSEIIGKVMQWLHYLLWQVQLALHCAFVWVAAAQSDIATDAVAGVCNQLTIANQCCTSNRTT